jgi:ferredoxin
MKTGVILLTSNADNENDSLREKLEARSLAVIQCNENDASEIFRTVADFVSNNALETAVLANFLPDPPREVITNALEKVKLGRLAVSWIDLVPIFYEGPSRIDHDSAATAILVGAVRQQRADHIGHTLTKLVPPTSRVTRRELFRSIPKLFRVETDIPILDAGRCKGRADSCDYCRKVCPTNAISVSGDTVIINEKLCIECGACARDCPIGALQSPSISDTQILEMLTELSRERFGTQKSTLLLTCSIGYSRLLKEARQGKRLAPGVIPIQIPCVAIIGDVHNLWSRALGVPLVPICPDRSCSKIIAMSSLKGRLVSSKETELPNDAPSVIRYLLQDSNRSIADSVSQAVAQTSMPAQPINLFGNSRREITLYAIQTGPHNGEEFKRFEEGQLPIFDLEVDPATCTFCESCSANCPDQAIKFTRSDDNTTLTFTPASCTGCLICEKRCPEHAITVSRLRDFAPIYSEETLEKARDENAKCENCGAFLGSKRSSIALTKRLLKQGVSDAALGTLNLCIQCKQAALLKTIGLKTAT